MDFRIERPTAERLTALRLCAGHLTELTVLHLDPEVSRFLGGMRSPAETAAYLSANRVHWRQHGHGLWVLRGAGGRFAGRAGLRRIEVEGAPETEIAYTLRRDLWCQGLATGSARALVERWRARRLSASLIGIASLENAASRRVLDKAGFAYERDAAYHGEAVALYGSASRGPSSRTAWTRSPRRRPGT